MAEAYATLVTDAGNTGSKVRLLTNSISGQTVAQQVVSLADSAGALIEQEVQGLPIKQLAAAATTGSHTATGSTSVSCKGHSSVLVTVSGTYVATLALEASDDGGSTYWPVRGIRVDTGLAEHTPGALTNVSRVWVVPVAGMTNFRIRVTAYTSGTVTVRVLPFSGVFPDMPQVLSKGKTRNLSNTVTAIKTTKGVLKGLQINNNQAAVAYIQVFDVATGGVTLGTTVPDWEGQVPASSQKEFAFPGDGIPFDTAISIASTTTSAGSTGSGSGVHAHYQYL